MNSTDPAFVQRRAARWAGALYLITMATSVVSEMGLKRSLIAPGDATQTAKNLLAHETEFRAALTLDVLTALGVTGLIAALYLVLRPAHKATATLGAMLRLTENAVAYMTIVFGLMSLWFLRDAPYLAAFNEAQRHVLTRFLLYANASSLSCVFVVLGVGSAVFALAWRRSGYIPRWFANFGFWASLLLTGSMLTSIVLTEISPYLLHLMMPLGVFEVGLGVYLLAGRARIGSTLDSDNQP